VAIDRDDHDERLARIEQMIEDLRREHPAGIESHLETIKTSQRTYQRAATVQAELKQELINRQQRRKRKALGKKS